MFQDISNVQPVPQDQTKHISDLTATTAQLERDLQDLQSRINMRVSSVAGKGFHEDDVLEEYALLEEDTFWRDEILTRLNEHTDELLARRLIQQEKQEAMERSTQSSPARRDAEYAQNFYEMEREFEIATRKRLDNDQASEKLAAQLAQEEKSANESKEDCASPTPRSKPRMRIIRRLLTHIAGRNNAKRVGRK